MTLRGGQGRASHCPILQTKKWKLREVKGLAPADSAGVGQSGDWKPGLTEPRCSTCNRAGGQRVPTDQVGKEEVWELWAKSGGQRPPTRGRSPPASPTRPLPAGLT